jgi:PAS domain S-box-containing protein
VFGGITALGTIVVVLWNVGVAWRKKVTEATSYLNNISNALSREFTPNGGSSLRDAINRIELRQILIENRCNLLITDWDYGVFELDEKGCCTNVNKTYCHEIGCSRDEVIGLSWLQAVAPEWRGRVLEAWEASAKLNIELDMRCEYYNKATGKNVPVHVRANRLLAYDKKIIGWLGVVEYITT